jgi:FAD:protein FMN transferase
MMNIKRLLFLPFLLSLLLLSSCSGPQREARQITIRGAVFGTYYSIIYFDRDARVFEESIDSLLAVFNQSLSYYEKNSLISRINRNETDQVDAFFREVFLRSREISVETDGAFDATVSPLVNAWGFGFSERAVISAELIDSLMDFVGYDKAWMEGDRVVKSDERLQFDFNAIAKGYAADVVGVFLESKGIGSYLVEIGGDLVARGRKPDGTSWRIGLEKPAPSLDAPQEWEYFVEIVDRGLATSGNYRRYYEEDGMRYSHTIDPGTGHPVDHHLLSVSVFAPDCMSADAYATAFMVMGLPDALEFVESREDLEAFFVFATPENGFESMGSSGLELHPRAIL